MILESAGMTDERTVLGRTKRGPKPSSLYRQLAKKKDDEREMIEESLQMLSEMEIERGERRSDMQVAVEEFLKIKIPSTRERRYRDILDVLLEIARAKRSFKLTVAMYQDGRPRDGRFWMLRSCGWTPRNGEYWYWWCEVVDNMDRLDLWDLSLEGQTIDRQVERGQKEGKRFVRRVGTMADVAKMKIVTKW